MAAAVNEKALLTWLVGPAWVVAVLWFGPALVDSPDAERVRSSELSELHVTVQCEPRSGERLTGAPASTKRSTRVHDSVEHQ